MKGAHIVWHTVDVYNLVKMIIRTFNKCIMHYYKAFNVACHLVPLYLKVAAKLT